MLSNKDRELGTERNARATTVQRSNPNMFIINGIEVPYASTSVAVIRSPGGRTKFYEAVKELGLTPRRFGNRSMWTVDQCDQVAEHQLSQKKAKLTADYTASDPEEREPRGERRASQ